ncbi:MAG: molybdenum cofactor biosynthesis protein MoaE [Verrucomicrobiota bacterium]|jgi:molybdopterin synthase catalytic subunit|nr:molybdenum cofactor biosynthesis protein MoaE [Verrucomicrobiota bacterium]MDP7049047.1 molybdenum cofactor biosynthesis protein MoaE [Verrucomicrobiota bacterium]
MKTELTITTDPIDEAALAKRRVMDNGMGAVVCFLGVVRGNEGNETIAAIEYEAFEPMARRQFEFLFDALGQRWPVEAVRVVHRIGTVPVNEPSLWVEVIAPHRAEAFDACQFLIDEMKQKVPIWKKPIPI